MFALVNGLSANPPAAPYIFPAGGQRGTTVEFKVGGVFLLKGCPFEMLGPGVRANERITRATQTRWLEGPILPMPESQRAEDYPKDYAGRVIIAADAPLGLRPWRVWTSEGGTQAHTFMVGELPEIVENEIDGDALPVEVHLPVTINGRIFPRENVDAWSFHARRGETVHCEVHAARLGSPLDARMEVLDAQGHKLVENDDGRGVDPCLRFTAPADGTYQVRIFDVNYNGSQAHVYRLTLTTAPRVDWIYPLGGRRGSQGQFQLGWQDTATGKVTSMPAAAALPADGPSTWQHRFAIGSQQTNALVLDLDELPEHQQAKSTPAIEMPAMLNGRIGTPGHVDQWSLALNKGDVCDLEVRAQRLGSPLAAVLTVSDAADKVLAKTAPPGVTLVDPRLSFKAPADGTYTVRVADQFASRGGPAFGYRLRVAPPSAEPDFHLTLSDSVVTLNRGGEAKLRVTATRSGGFNGAIRLDLEGLPHGVSVANTAMAAGQGSVDLVFKETPAALLGGQHVAVRGRADIDKKEVTRQATATVGRDLQLDHVLFVVAQPPPFKIKGEHDFRWAARGTIVHRHYRIERGGYSGSLEVSLADRQMRHLQGMAGPTITVPAGVDEFDYPVTLPPWMETGRTARAVVQAVGTVRDADGTTHEVCFSSGNPSEQVTVVVEPGRLGLQLARSSVTATPGGKVTLPLRVTRGKGLIGPTQVDLVAVPHIRGVTAEPLTIPADRGDGILTLHFAATGPLGPFNQALTLRATIIEKGEPVIAESHIDVFTGR
jgi:hypothetical protein